MRRGSILSDLGLQALELRKLKKKFTKLLQQVTTEARARLVAMRGYLEANQSKIGPLLGVFRPIFG